MRHTSHDRYRCTAIGDTAAMRTYSENFFAAKDLGEVEKFCECDSRSVAHLNMYCWETLSNTMLKKKVIEYPTREEPACVTAIVALGAKYNGRKFIRTVLRCPAWRNEHEHEQLKQAVYISRADDPSFDGSVAYVFARIQNADDSVKVLSLVVSWGARKGD